MKVLREMLDSRYNSSNFVFKLSLSPSEVMNLIEKNTDEASVITNLLSSNLKKSHSFVSKFEKDDTFKVAQKWSSNSFSPWLVGQITEYEQGSLVSISFEIPAGVNSMNKMNISALLFFTILISSCSIISLFDSTIKADIFLGVIAMALFWLVYYGFTKFSFRSGQQEKKALVDFVESLFQSFIIRRQEI